MTVSGPRLDLYGIVIKKDVYVLPSILIVEMGYVNTICGVAMGHAIMGKHVIHAVTTAGIVLLTTTPHPLTIPHRTTILHRTIMHHQTITPHRTIILHRITTPHHLQNTVAMDIVTIQRKIVIHVIRIVDLVLQQNGVEMVRVITGKLVLLVQRIAERVHNGVVTVFVIQMKIV